MVSECLDAELGAGCGIWEWERLERWPKEPPPEVLPQNRQKYPKSRAETKPASGNSARTYLVARKRTVVDEGGFLPWLELRSRNAV